MTSPGFYWIRGTATVIRLDESGRVKDPLLSWEPAECYHVKGEEMWDYLWSYLGDEDNPPTVVGPRLEVPR